MSKPIGTDEMLDRIEELEERLKAAQDDAKEAEAYAEELEAENKNLRHMIIDQIEGAGDDPEIMAASRAEWAARAKAAEFKLKSMAMDNIAADLSSEVSADRIEELEAKLAKAVEALRVFADDANWFDTPDGDGVTMNPTWRGPTFTPEQFARDVIAELTGGKDD